MQLSVRHDGAARLAEARGVEVIMNRCPKIEFGRLSGELGWYGVNTGVLSNRARVPPVARPLPLPPQLKVDSGNPPMGFGTRAIHAGVAPDPITGALPFPFHRPFPYHGYHHREPDDSEPYIEALELVKYLE